MKVLWKPLILVSVLFLNTSSCSHWIRSRSAVPSTQEMGKNSKVEYRPHVESPSKQQFIRRAIGDFNSNRISRALKNFQSYLKKNPDGASADKAHIYSGLIQLKKKQYARAITSFEAVTSMTPPSRYRGTAYHNLARIYRAQDKNSEALRLLPKARVNEFLFQNEKADYFLFWGRVAQSEDKKLDATLAYLLALPHLKKYSEKKIVRSEIERNIKTQLKLSDLNLIVKRYSDPQYPTSLVRLRQSELHLLKGRAFRAKTALDYVFKYAKPGTANYLEAQKMKTRFALHGLATKSAGVKLGKIGALLPRKGPAAKWGLAVQEGINLSLKENRNHRALHVVYRDPGTTPDSAAKAAEALIREEGVMLVIGPPTGSQAERAAYVAADYGVPFVSLAARAGKIEQNPMFLRFSMSADKQVQAILQHAWKRLGAKRFAMLFPQDKFGATYAEAFFKEAKELGARVTAVASYEPREVDFKLPIQNLVGTAHPHHRQTELNDMRRAMQRQLKRKLTRSERRRLTLKPILDFDMLFLPDTYRAIGQIAPSLAYADMDMTMMGPATWNNSQLLRRAGNYLKGAYFVDLFSRYDEDPRVQSFVNRFKNEYGKTPGTLSAQGYDLTQVLIRAYGKKDAQPQTRDELMSRLTHFGNYNGVLGIHSWDERKDPLIEFRLFQVQSRKFVSAGRIRIDPRKRLERVPANVEEIEEQQFELSQNTVMR